MSIQLVTPGPHQAQKNPPSGPAYINLIDDKIHIVYLNCNRVNHLVSFISLLKVVHVQF